MIKETSVIKYNEDTGEVYYSKLENSQSKLWADGKGAILKPRNYHCKIYQDVKLYDIINDKQDLLRTYILMEHIYKNTNIIYIQKSKTIFRPATIEDISTILDIRIRSTKEYINRMKEKGIIAEITTKIQNEEYTAYIFNPVYINTCKYISNQTYLLFKPYLDKYFPQWIIDKYSELKS